MIGLPLAPSYLPGIPTPQQQSVMATIPPIRHQLNRYRYAALLLYIFFFCREILFLMQNSFFFLLFALFCLEKRMNDPNIGECIIMFFCSPSPNPQKMIRMKF
jgi:hypothetical protein